ncbi:monosaccharide ABC transporter membrane protein, CUT2 family [Nocardioides exalbidus]|uniref:Monosaccharide ABC transporter membrane protein, CUT2 family n=1 Tax=Nocardioides exalbidus TaxID=402596 RepID=A0A1H4UHB5_9ACTN|nr:ABC transporter permease [Nocardioides exalbidus]SEC67524.1 monosaccharide ABC transporter membrane protein, CUT2 family [Nocardioides exalbidus]
MSAATDRTPEAPAEPTASVRRRRAARPKGPRERLSSTQLIYLVLVGVVAVSIALTANEGRNFFSQGNIWAILTAMSVLGLIAIGQTLVILVGSLDLSVPYVVSLSTLIAAGGMKGLDSNFAPAVVNTLVTVAVIGLVMGVLVSVFDVHGFIASLGIGLVVSGYLATNYQGSHGAASPQLRLLGRSGIAATIPTSFIILLVAALLVTLLLRYTRLGHHLYAIGGNRAVARMSGVRTALPVIAAHVLCSVLAGIAGLLLLSRTGVGLPTIGSQGRYDLLSIAAVVLGGTLLAGGKGSVIGTIGGVAIFAVIDNVMGVMQVNPFLKDFVRGLVIVLAVAVYARRSVVRRPPRFGADRTAAPTKEETA